MINMVAEILKKYFKDLDVELNLDKEHTRKKIEIDDEECVSCNRCVEVCPVDAISPNQPFAPNISEKCVYCGACVEICPVDAIKITKAKIKISGGELKIEKNHEKNKKLIYIREKCVLCLVCLKNCPFDAISESDEGLKFDPKKCVLCGHCGDVCPADAIEFE